MLERIHRDILREAISALQNTSTQEPIQNNENNTAETLATLANGDEESTVEFRQFILDKVVPHLSKDKNQTLIATLEKYANESFKEETHNYQERKKQREEEKLKPEKPPEPIPDKQLLSVAIKEKINELTLPIQSNFVTITQNINAQGTQANKRFKITQATDSEKEDQDAEKKVTEKNIFSDTKTVKEFRVYLNDTDDPQKEDQGVFTRKAADEQKNPDRDQEPKRSARVRKQTFNLANEKNEFDKVTSSLNSNLTDWNKYSRRGNALTTIFYIRPPKFKNIIDPQVEALRTEKDPIEYKRKANNLLDNINKLIDVQTGQAKEGVKLHPDRIASLKKLHEAISQFNTNIKAVNLPLHNQMAEHQKAQSLQEVYEEPFQSSTARITALEKKASHQEVTSHPIEEKPPAPPSPKSALRKKPQVFKTTPAPAANENASDPAPPSPSNSR